MKLKIPVGVVPFKVIKNAHGRHPNFRPSIFIKFSIRLKSHEAHFFTKAATGGNPINEI